MSNWMPRAKQALRRGLRVMQALPPMRLSQWAAEYFYLSAESSYTQGKWQAYPYQIAILDAFGNDDIEEVSVKKAARTGYTKMLMAAMAYFTAFRRRNQAIWQPTDSDAQEFVETEYNPMLRDVEPIRAVFPALEKKHQHNTNSYKHFLGCVAYIKGGSTARNYRRISVDVAIIDEVDGFDKDIDQEGSPRKLAKKRTEGATFPKMIVGSTPKIKYLSEIDAAIQEADAIYTYRIPCPHCDHFQPLDFGGKTSSHGLKWLNKDPSTAAYLCIACSTLFTQSEYLSVWKRGYWQDNNGNTINNETGQFHNASGEVIRPPRHIAFDRLWTIYSPQSTWANIVREYIAAVAKAKHGEKSDLKAWINTTLGDVFEDDIDKNESADLKKRAEDYPLQIIPKGGLLAYAGIDVQKDRFEMVVYAIGVEEEMWVIDYHVIPANPAIQSEWDKLDPYLQYTYSHSYGNPVTIERAALDTGGHWTHQCYNYIRNRKTAQGWTNVSAPTPKLFATKGSSKANQPISGRATLQDVNAVDKTIRQGIRLYSIGTDTAKDLIHGRLQVTQHGPGFIHLSKYLPDEFFDHLTNEVRVIKQTNKGQISAWVLKRAGLRNEALDCTVMTLFCCHNAALHRKTKAEWQALEKLVQPNQNDLFNLDLIAPPAVQQPIKTTSPINQYKPIANDAWSARL
jgi:phage terminase large subunit GpA-like protein